MTHTTEQERALADLRHLYAQMVGGLVKDSAQAKRIADGILSRAIQKLEQAARRAPVVPVQQEPTSKQVVLGAGALLGQPENTADNRHPDWHSAVAKARSVYLAMISAAPQPSEADMGIPISKPVHQYRVAYCSDWYDGHPDTSDGKKYQTRVLYTAPVNAYPPLSDAQIYSACLSYRHDFGLLPEDERKRLMFQAREWERALGKASKAA